MMVETRPADRPATASTVAGERPWLLGVVMSNEVKEWEDAERSNDCTLRHQGPVSYRNRAVELRRHAVISLERHQLQSL